MTAERIPSYRIVALDNRHQDFYAVMGPVLSRREIVAELGSPTWDDDGKEWLVALPEDSPAPLGFVAKRGRSICSFYVSPGARGLAVGYALLRRAVATWPNADRATATDSSVSLFERVGFTETRKRGRYHVMERAEG